jgi:FkbM family methyltransferase
MHFVDCGANIGYFTMLAARCVGPGGRVDAFEPDPLNRRRLVEHLHANGLTQQVKVHSVALSDHAGTATLYHPTGGWSNHGQASLFVGPGEQCMEPYLVSLARLDEQLERMPNLIKMDIEGAELAALKGATKVLAMKRPPKIILELNVSSAAAAGYRPVELYDFLRSVQPQYGFYWIGWKQVEIRSREKFEGMMRLGNILVQSRG